MFGRRIQRGDRVMAAQNLGAGVYKGDVGHVVGISYGLLSSDLIAVKWQRGGTMRGLRPGQVVLA